jgi:CheY-like chemotaxis protein
MATLRTSELATTDVKRSGAFHGTQVLRQPACTRNTSNESNRVGTGARVLDVLVVDGEQDSANSLVRQVRYWGHAAHAALDGLAALREAAARHLDVVLLDMEMPLIDGCQVAQQLRSDHLSEECLVIAFAARADDACRIRSIEAGIDLLLSKPVDQDVVETLLMLESVRVNRQQAAGPVSNLAVDIRSKPC